jgi:mannose-6-phosphate isomerase-like protein (cupin superfamily)
VGGSMIVSHRDVPSDILGAHGGSNVVQWKRLATGGMLHSDIESFEWNRVPSGAVIGEHVHTHTEEIYYIIAGRAEMRLGDESRAVGPGDLIITPLGGRHGIANVGETDLDFLVIEVHPPAITDRLPAKIPVAAGGDR